MSRESRLGFTAVCAITFALPSTRVMAATSEKSPVTRVEINVQLGEAVEKFVLERTPQGADLRYESNQPRTAQAKFSIEEFNWFAAEASKLPSVPKLPDECLRDSIEVEVVPSRNVKRGTCLRHKTGFSAAYRSFYEKAQVLLLKAK